MALSFLQQVLVCSLLVLCVGLLIPRMLGGSRNPWNPASVPVRHQQPIPTAVPGKGQPYDRIQKKKAAMEHELMSKQKEGNGRSLTFTLMPLYALGVGIFAAYKFIKIQSEQEHSSKKEKKAEAIKTKETEKQLMELEQHLAQTEVMLNSLLLQLDPLSNCVNALATGQRQEIMTQLQSIRALMKESGIDKSSRNNEVENSASGSKLEDLIQSFGQHHKRQEIVDNKGCCATEDREDLAGAGHYREEGVEEDDYERYTTGSKELEDTFIHNIDLRREATGLRKRSIKE
ncbi:protein RIC-3-like [Lissotriton helveticus]